MAQELIQDFCSSANTVAMGTKEQLPCNWINIRLLLRHSAPRRELVQVPPPAPSTWSWICMAPVINVHSVCNVCGAAYMVDKQLYVNYAVIGVHQVCWSSLQPPGPQRWCWCCVRLRSGITETSSGPESELLVILQVIIGGNFSYFGSFYIEFGKFPSARANVHQFLPAGTSAWLHRPPLNCSFSVHPVMDGWPCLWCISALCWYRELYHLTQLLYFPSSSFFS